MDRRIWAIALAATAGCLIFLALFIGGAGPQCLPQGVLGVVPTPAYTPKPAYTTRATFHGSAEDLPILDALVKAAGPSESESYADELQARFCRFKELALGLEISATILAAVALGFWTSKKP